MSCSYNQTLPTDRDWVRFLIGDVDCTAAFFSDEELDAILSEMVALSPSGAALSRKYCAASFAWNDLVARLGSVRGEGTVGPIIEKVVGRLRLTFGGGRDNTLQESLKSYGRYLADRCVQLSSARPVWVKSVADVPVPCPTVIKSSGEGGS